MSSPGTAASRGVPFLFAVRYAIRALRRGGQRMLAAAASIAIGVASFVALLLLAAAVRDAVLIGPAARFGGDMVLTREDSAGHTVSVTPAQLRSLDSLRSTGALTAVSPISEGGAIFARREGNGRLTFVRAQGVDPASYPLAGAFRLTDERGTDQARTILARPGEAVVTRDVAERLGLVVGSGLVVAGQAAPALHLRVGGIATMTPNHRGGQIFYSIATGATVQGTDLYSRMTRVLLTLPDGGATPQSSHIVDELHRAGWTVDEARAVPPDATARLIDFLLRGAALLGLLLGGVGIANTMRVLLAGRARELATFKAIGYRRHDVLLLLGTEAALLGAGAAAAGILVALPLASVIVDKLNMNGFAFLIALRLDPAILVTGWLLGIATAVAFATYIAVQASAVRPALVLRGDDAPAPSTSRAASVATFLPLLAVLIMIGATVMGSLVRGGAVVLAGTLLLGVVGGILALILRGIAAIPLPAWMLSGAPLLGMARRNLKRRTLESAFATTGLSVGVFAIGLAVAAWLGARTQLLNRTGGAHPTVSVTVIASRADSSHAVATMTAAGSRAAGSPAVPAMVPAGSRGVMQGMRVPDSTITMTMSVPADRANHVTDELAGTLPNALIFTDRDVNDFIVSVYRGLFAFAVSLAGLAVIMGLVLLANVVSLAMRERRREHAVLKAIGYSRMAVMRLVLTEQALIGVIAGGTGLAAVVAVREMVNAMEPRAHFTLPPLAMVALLVGCGLLTTLAATVIAASALRVRPLVVLRGE